MPIVIIMGMNIMEAAAAKASTAVPEMAGARCNYVSLFIQNEIADAD